MKLAIEMSQQESDGSINSVEYAFTHTIASAAPLTLRNLKYFSFPTEKANRDIWIVCCGREFKDYTKSSKICSRHFSLDQYDLPKLKRNGYKTNGVRILLKNAVPDIDVKNSKSPSDSQEQRCNRKRKRDEVSMDEHEQPGR